MPAPLIGLAVGAVARLAAKKAAQEAAKKAAKKTATKAAAKGYGMGKKGLTVSNNVRVKPSTTSSKIVSRGAKQAIDENLKTAGKATKTATKANARALKAANKPTNKTGSAMNKLERKYFQGKGEMVKSMQNTERAGLSKSSRKTTKKK